MSKSIAVTDGTGVLYNIELRNSFAKLGAELKRLGYSPEQKICIVTDSNVAALYADEVSGILRADYPNLFTYVFPAGEQSKNVSTINGLYETLIRNHFERNDLLLALGGGVVGDLTGFAAATYLRGIAFIQVPTTLLSQVDSSIGGKTGVDFMQYKNMVGAFYQPALVYMNLSVLSTLPEKQIISGMAEIIKHGLIKDGSYFQWIKEHRTDIMRLQPDVLEEMIFCSCEIKRKVVERDPKEKGERALLNFGHTIGHAIEKLSDFKLYHGECVAQGMVAAAFLSMKMGNISEAAYGSICDILHSFGFAVKVSGFSPETILEATKSDKKMAGGRVKFILLREIGDACIYHNLSDEQILDAITVVCD